MDTYLCLAWPGLGRFSLSVHVFPLLLGLVQDAAMNETDYAKLPYDLGAIRTQLASYGIVIAWGSYCWYNRHCVRDRKYLAALM